ncbi:MAG TPA: HAD-IC family P-type ATPase [Kineosporiaceae bacterium]|nr:HAD-IC family P-type ATPase [Kineosporiaceae bacterium]
MITFQLAGRYFETRARRGASEVLRALGALTVREARVLRDGVEHMVPAAGVRAAETIVVLPGERLPVDGTVLEGESTVDTSAMTGESVPRETGPGDHVLGGTVNLVGRLEIRADAVGAHTRLAQMAALAEDAQRRKARIQRTVDRVSAVFVPAVIALAAVVAAARLTSDGETTARTVGAQVGVDEVIFDVLPHEKAHVVERLQADGHRVAMVGDGINDAAALATADLGIAVVRGTDIAIKSADVVLVRDDLRAVADAIQLARQTLRTIRGNLWWAFGYNVAALPIAAIGLLNPLIAAAAMSFSSTFVVSNSQRRRNFTTSPPRRPRQTSAVSIAADASDQKARCVDERGGPSSSRSRCRWDALGRPRTARRRRPRTPAHPRQRAQTALSCLAAQEPVPGRIRTGRDPDKAAARGRRAPAAVHHHLHRSLITDHPCGEGGRPSPPIRASAVRRGCPGRRSV